MFSKGSHLAQANASQGFKAYKRWCGETGRNAPKMPDYLAREDVQRAYPQAAPVAEVTTDLSKLTKAQLIALVQGESTPVAPVAPASAIAVGVKFEYTRRDGTTTQREVLGINADGSLRVFNVEHNVESKRPWKGIERQIAKGQTRLI